MLSPVILRASRKPVSAVQTDDLASHLEIIPHSKALGMRMERYDGDECVLAIGYSNLLVGDPDTGVIHGGAITALLDNAAGFVARPEDMPREEAAIATLDMRIDYMGAAEPDKDVFASAHCFKRTRNVAFVRAVAYQVSPDDPIATCTTTFMLGTRNTPFSATGSQA